MKIKDLPQDIQDVVKLRCEEQNKEFDLEKSLGVMFDWYSVIESHDIWHEVYYGNFQPFYDFHKKEKEVKVGDLKVGDVIRYDNYHLCEYRGVKVDTFNLNTKGERVYSCSWDYVLKIKRATPDEVKWYNACKEANKFIPKEEVLKEIEEFKEDEYIVNLLDYNSRYIKKNHIYKQRKTNEKLYAIKDSFDGTETKSEKVCFKDPSNWRYATAEEAAEYERLGKPYDVTTLQKSDDFTFRYTGNLGNAVYCDSKEEFECLVEFLKRENVDLDICASSSNKSILAIAEHCSDKNRRSRWVQSTKDRFINDTTTFKTYSFKEYQVKLTTIGVSLFPTTAPTLDLSEDFKIGDKVICIYDSGVYLTDNKVYAVSKVSGEYIEVKNDHGSKINYFKTRFQKVPNHIPEGIILHSPLDAGSYVGSVSSDDIVITEFPNSNSGYAYKVHSEPQKSWEECQREINAEKFRLEQAKYFSSKYLIKNDSTPQSLSEILAPKPKQKKAKPSFELKSINQLNK